MLTSGDEIGHCHQPFEDGWFARVHGICQVDCLVTRGSVSGGLQLVIDATGDDGTAQLALGEVVQRGVSQVQEAQASPQDENSDNADGYPIRDANVQHCCGVNFRH
jgi:hypothetical protein